MTEWQCPEECGREHIEALEARLEASTRETAQFFEQLLWLVPQLPEDLFDALIKRIGKEGTQTILLDGLEEDND